MKSSDVHGVTATGDKITPSLDNVGSGASYHFTFPGSANTNAFILIDTFFSHNSSYSLFKASKRITLTYHT